MVEPFNYEQFLPPGHKVHPFIILELSDLHKNALHELNTNQEFPTIDPDALMSAVLEAININNYDENPTDDNLELHQILEETLGDPGHMPSDVKQKIVDSTSIVIAETMLLLEKNGVFINGAQPYEFACFTSSNDAVLRKSPTIGY